MSDLRARADAIDLLLPQTQCTRCGFDGCRPYAESIARGESDINRCPPGGQAGIVRLAALTGRPVRPLDAQCGVEQARRVAWIDPERCIGCAKCIAACPVDAIIGASKWLHAVVPQSCTGCDLCVAPCPVDCIEMQPLPAETVWTDEDARSTRQRYVARTVRLQSELRARGARLAAKNPSPPADSMLTRSDSDSQHKRATIEAVLERARRQQTPAGRKARTDPS